MMYDWMFLGRGLDSCVGVKTRILGPTGIHASERVLTLSRNRVAERKSDRKGEKGSESLPVSYHLLMKK